MVLSFSTTPAESSNISPPQQLYNAALRLPTQFQFRTQPLSEAPASPPPSGLPLPQPIHHNIHLSASPPSTFPPKLLRASHILVHRDAAAPTLTPVYTDPFQSFFTLLISSHSRSAPIQILFLCTASRPLSWPPPQPPPLLLLEVTLLLLFDPPSALCFSSLHTFTSSIREHDCQIDLIKSQGWPIRIKSP